MLQSIPYSLPPAEFNWELAARGFYTKMQKERSDKALDEFEKELQPKISGEMAAFLELEGYFLIVAEIGRKKWSMK